jgi:hypothetical protein
MFTWITDLRAAFARLAAAVNVSAHLIETANADAAERLGIEQTPVLQHRNGKTEKAKVGR